MLTRLTLRNFKNFRDVRVDFGSFTVLVGANASGKSNLRDAFRFLHGAARGYRVAEIADGAYGDGGEHVWTGIRGGSTNLAFRDANQFDLDASTDDGWRYQIRVENRPSSPETPSESSLLYPSVERITKDGSVVLEADQDEKGGQWLYALRSADSDVAAIPRKSPDDLFLLGQIRRMARDEYPTSYFQDEGVVPKEIFLAMRFVDFSPSALRHPSKQGQTTLGDRGQNLASVLMNLCRDPGRKDAIVDWLSALTPMDAKDVAFDVAKHTGDVTMLLVESDGTQTPMQSASDGTLRFLALLALLFQDAPPSVLFIEEMETGLHPTRLRLLVNLIEQRTEDTDMQVIASTHSPQTLQALSTDRLENARLIYRTGNGPEAKICPLLDVPSARDVLSSPNQTVGDLHRTGWFEDVLAFSRSENAVG